MAFDLHGVAIDLHVLAIDLHVVAIDLQVFAIDLHAVAIDFTVVAIDLDAGAADFFSEAAYPSDRRVDRLPAEMESPHVLVARPCRICGTSLHGISYHYGRERSPVTDQLERVTTAEGAIHDFLSVGCVRRRSSLTVWAGRRLAA